MAHSLGEGRKEEAVRYAQGSLQLGILFAVLFSVAALSLVPATDQFFWIK